MSKFFRYAFLAIILFSLMSACKVRKKDCRGKRKTTKTEMGGWL
jgi:hypothetical protein